MTLDWPRAWGEPLGTAAVRSSPEDFQVREQLGFDLAGAGEHVFLHLEKRELNTLQLQERLGALSGVPLRDIGYSGLKDRNAITSQWFSIGLAGRSEPDWLQLESEGDVRVLEVGRHQRKLRRGVHRANEFTLVLRRLTATREQLEERLAQFSRAGVPNYFGEQRFGREGSTLHQAQRWAVNTRRLTRSKRSLYLSALRGYLFNEALAQRVGTGSWNKVSAGDTVMLRGSRSFFSCAEPDGDLARRCAEGDVHPGLPLVGTGDASIESPDIRAVLAEHEALVACLQKHEVALAWRAARLIPDDFCWQFCDDDTLQLEFALGPGSYATALLRELVVDSNKNQKIAKPDTG